MRRLASWLHRRVRTSEIGVNTSLFLLVTLFVLLGTWPVNLFSAPTLSPIEIVPAPVDNEVGVSSVVVRGSYSGERPLRIAVSGCFSSPVYVDRVIRITKEVFGYYAHGVPLGTGGPCTITLQEQKPNGMWSAVPGATTQVTYNPANTRSLWGRIANSGPHWGEEQRAIYFYAGPRIIEENMTMSYPVADVSPLFPLFIIEHGRLLYLPQNAPIIISRKDNIDTKGPANPLEEYWSSPEGIAMLFQEIKAAGVNIIMFTWWGDLEEEISEEFPSAPVGIPDNYWKIYSAPTLPKTCRYELRFAENFCTQITGGLRFDAPASEENPGILKRSPCECQCSCENNPLCWYGFCSQCQWNPNKGEFFCGDENMSCYFNLLCKRKCISAADCSPGEDCVENIVENICKKRCTNQPTDCPAQEICVEGYCEPNFCQHFPYFEETSCYEPFSEADYQQSGINTHGRRYDVIDQMFKAAVDAGLLVVPVMEYDPFHYFLYEFPHNLAPIRKRISQLLTKYGDHPNWLYLYDKEGYPRKAIYLLQALSIRPGIYRENGVDIVIGKEDYANALDSLAEEFSVGFILDPTALGPDYQYENMHTPSIDEYLRISSLLAVSPFGLPFAQHLTIRDKVLTWASSSSSPLEPIDEPIEDHLMNKAWQWVSEWKSPTEGNRVPLVVNVIPGFDDRWRAPMSPSVFNVFGDNPSWRERNAALAFLFNTAGISLAIWNGYGEGYVWTPYRKRLFLRDERYQIDSSYQSGPLAIPQERLNLIFATRGNLPPDDPRYIGDKNDPHYNDPVHEDHIVTDNYCYAGYLFSQDADGDGVPDACDNCPTIRNPMVLAMGEVAFGYNGPDDYSNGALFNPKTRKHTKTVWGKFGIPSYYWQPDHDLDGVGDACDPDTAYVKPLEVVSPPMKQGADSSRTYIANEYLTLKVQATTTQEKSVPSTNRYCWITKNEYLRGLWGTPGYCSVYRPEPEPGKPFVWQAGRSFGYSHGSEIEPVRLGKPVWHEMSWTFDPGQATTVSRGDNQDNFPASFYSILLGKSSIQWGKFSLNLAAPIVQLHWNWREDVVKDREDYAANLVDEEFDPEHTFYEPPYHIFNLADNDFFFAFSTGPRDEDSALNYLKPENLPGNAKVNEFYFRLNSTETTGGPYYLPLPLKQYARSIRLQSEPIGISYRQFIIDSSAFLQPPIYYDHFKAKWRYLGLIDFSRDPGLDHSAARRWDLVENSIVALAKYHDEKMLTLIAGDDGITYGIRPDDDPETPATFWIVQNLPTSTGDWEPIGVFTLPHTDYELLTAAQHGEAFYAILKEAGAPALVEATLSDPETGEWTLATLAAVPAALTSPTIHWLGETLHVLGSDPSGMKLYRLDGGNLVAVTGALVPPTRDFYNAYASGDALYLAGGKKSGDIVTYPKDIWRYTAGAGWVKLADNVSSDLFKTFMRVSGNSLILVNQALVEGNIASRVTVDLTAPIGSNVTVDTVEVFGLSPAGESAYCLDENDGLVKGGTRIGGFCQPFTHPWYQSFSVGTTIYSVAGKGSRLYVGTNSTIRIYDISDPNALTLKYTFTTNKRVYDLEVVGDTLYAATSGGLYKFSIANPDTLVQEKFLSTPYNYQYRLEYYDGKLYVGDDNGINIRDKDTFARLAYVNFGSVVDFAIANGEIALYWYVFWDEGVQIRNVANLALKAWEYGYCSSGELTTDHGAFYLSCDNYEYRFAGRPDTYIDFYPLDGDWREMQENHLYNGWVYIPDGNKVKLSTNSAVPSICGNGIVEPGEVCDGNSIACGELDPNQWNGGTATCNSTCTGYNTTNCYWGGC